MTKSPAEAGWPAHVRPGALRFAHASGRYDETIPFYRDVVGLPVIGGFTGSFGEDGTIFGLPDTSVQLEVVRAHGNPDSAMGEFDQLVLYLADADAVAAATAPLRSAGLAPNPAPHPYRAANGAVVFRDPDGRDVVFAPWIYGREPDPVDRIDGEPTLRIDWYDGDRENLRPMFELAEDSRKQLDSYFDLGRVLVASRGAEIVGHLQLVPYGDDTDVELKSMAVEPPRRGIGVGRALIERALSISKDEGRTRMLVSTGGADTGNLRFYQRCGFRLLSIDRDAFTPATGYHEPISIDGVPLRDRVWLDQDL